MSSTTIKHPHEWTAEETEAAIMRALEERDFQGVDYGLRLLCTKDPRRACDIYDTMLMAVHLAKLGYTLEAQ